MINHFWQENSLGEETIRQMQIERYFKKHLVRTVKKISVSWKTKRLNILETPCYV